MSGLSILALDLVLGRTGVAGITDLDPVPRVRTIEPKGLTGYQRNCAILAEIVYLVTTRHPQLVIIEDVPPRMQQGLVGRVKLLGIVEHYLTPRAPYLLVNPTYVKMYALGKGGGAGTDKDDMRIAAERRYGHLVKCDTHDEADALHLLAMACDHYGQPLTAMPKTHTRALNSVTWPALPAPDDSPLPAATLTHHGDLQRAAGNHFTRRVSLP